MSRISNIIYEDETLIVCDKKAGEAVQSKSFSRMDMESKLKQYLFKKTGKRDVFLAPVHRLDQPVEGIVVFAKDSKIAANLSKQIKEHSVEKYYLAVVQGHFQEKQGCLVDCLVKETSANFSRVAGKGEKGGKEAKLEYLVLEDGEGTQLVKIHLLTGRHHQIRVQLSHANHPILGDDKYQIKDDSIWGVQENVENESEKNQHRLPIQEGKKSGIALCAYSLTFTHPVTKKPMKFEKKPSGEYFQEFTYIEGIGTY